METASFNLVQTTAVLQKNWKAILVFVLTSMIAATITVFMVPPYFKSAATIVPANPDLADKARLFNNNIQSLNSYFGSGDDLDRIYGMAGMNATYAKLVDEFSLVDFYSITGGDTALRKEKAVKCLRNDFDLKKTEENQLQIIAWTKDRQLSANLVNRMVAIIEETATGIWQKNYQQTIEKIDRSIISMEQEYRLLIDSMQPLRMGTQAVAAVKMGSLSEQIRQYRKTSNEFKLAAQAPPALLYVLEPASPAAYAERPDKPAIIFAASLIGFILGSLFILVGDRKSVG
jgi:LPS O-antigen subunit length determinant protein (WzzB/FepE family)